MIKYGLAALLLGAVSLTAAGPARSATSEWVRVQGGAVRIVVASKPGAEGRLRGALEIDLEPGWKTYWLDPGDAGVPPTVELAVLGEPGKVELGFPAPGRHDDGYAVWAGYDQPVALALTFGPPAQGPAARMDFSVFLGICQTICIPVQANFSIEPANGIGSTADDAVVEQAFAALPAPARPGFRVLAAAVDGESIVVEAELPPGDAAADLFIASTANRMFGRPEPEERGDRTIFRVPLLAGAEGGAEQVHYTLISGAEAVSGTILIGG